MKLTIIPSDNNVVIDGVSKLPLYWEGTPSDVHALQWDDVAGEIEYKNPTRNEPITELPGWANNAVASWEVGVIPPPVPPATAEQNKQKASALLYETDWTTIPDVSNPQISNPYLVNVDEFIAYRNTVRGIALNPPAGDIIFPVKPQAVWQST